MTDSRHRASVCFGQSPLRPRNDTGPGENLTKWEAER
jgi:hypothetical protein